MAIEQWNPGPVVSKAQKQMEFRLRKCAEMLRDEIRMLMPGAGMANATRAEREASRSAPGEPPHVQTARLKQSIVHSGIEKTLQGPQIRVGHHKDLKYGAALEFGTKNGHLLARPHIRPGFQKSKRRLQRILKTGK